MRDDQTPNQLGASESLAMVKSQGLRVQEIVDVAPEETPHLLDYWNVILKRRWLVLSSLLIVFFAIAIGTLKQKPVYQGRVLVEIDPEPPNVLNFKEILQVDTQDQSSYLETQYRILHSRSLAEHVVGDLKLYLYPEFYRSHRLLGLINRNPNKVPLPSDPTPPDPNSEAFRNSVENFLDSVDVNPVRQSNLVQVTVDSQDPRLAARMANQLSSDYIDQNLQVKWDETIKASTWLKGQLVGLKGKLEKSEDDLQSYAQKNDILFLAAGSDNAQSQGQEQQWQTTATLELQELQGEYAQAQADRLKKKALYDMVQQGSVENFPGYLNNQLIQNTLFQLSDLERKYADMTAVVKPEYPRAVALKKQIESVKKALQQEKADLAQGIVNEYQTAEAREDYLAKAVKNQTQVVNSLAKRMVQYNILKREVDTNKQLYEGLLQRLKQAQVSAGLKASNIRIVDAAQVPQSPVKPRVVLNLALGMILGLGLGVGLAFFLEYLDKTLKTPDEVENLVRLPSLGILPKFSLNGAGKVAEVAQASIVAQSRGTVAPAIQTNPEVLEAFRSLRTSILLSANPVPKLLLISSAFPSEGKTSVTVNLGATLASLGSRVVIVDCDMRRPACHRSTGVENKPGFVKCLTGQVELSKAILPVPNVNNLSVIPCGPIPPNPAEVLSSPIAGDLLRYLRDEFEYVLVDSPPLLSVADSRILATITDAVVLVARAHSTPYDAVRRAKTLLYGAGARILGVALNDVDFRKDGYAYVYYYRYGQGYGYGYGNRNSENDAPGDTGNV